MSKKSESSGGVWIPIAFSLGWALGTIMTHNQIDAAAKADREFKREQRDAQSAQQPAQQQGQ